jgi:hypothetical protein
MGKILWALKQILPLTYRACYRDEYDDIHYVTWKMWLGRCYQDDDEVIGDS